MAVAWEAETLRVSLFSSDATRVSDTDWKAITGQDEAEIRQMLAGRRSLSGEALGGRLSISSAGTRVDCILAVQPPNEPDESFRPTIGEWKTVLEKFVSANSGWLQEVPYEINRLAFGGTLLAWCNSHNEAYAKLLNLLVSVKADPDRMRDLIFRVNWRVKSRVVPGLDLNRITTWSVVKTLLRTVQVEVGRALVEDSEANYAIRLELDHNTPPGWPEAFEKRDLVPIYRELIELAQENADKGELP